MSFFKNTYKKYEKYHFTTWSASVTKQNSNVLPAATLGQERYAAQIEKSYLQVTKRIKNNFF